MKKQIYIPLIALLLTGAACQQSAVNTTGPGSNTNQTGNQNSSSAATEETVTLANLGGVTFGRYAQGALTAGDFRMSKNHLDTNSGRIFPLYVFGQPLPGRDRVQLNPNLEFGGLHTAITLVSAIDGVVGFVKEQDGDAEVFLQPKEGSAWTIGYDHVRDVTVKQGDRVTVGQVLGTAGPEQNGVFRYELQVNKDVNGETTFYCPTSLLRADAQTDAVTAIEQLLKDWNQFYGRDVYAPYTTSCTKPTLTVAESE